MQEIRNREDFDKALENDYVIIDCTASWCRPCKRIAPQIEKLSESDEYNKVKFYVYDIDDDDELSEEYVTVVPTFLFFKDRELIKKIEGADYKSIVKQLNQLVESSDESSEDSD